MLTQRSAIDALIETHMLRGVVMVLVCLSSLSLSGCGALVAPYAYSNLQKMQEERTRQAAEFQKMMTERHQAEAEAQRLAAEERRQALEERKLINQERIRQIEAERQRQQQYDETFKRLPPEQQAKIMLEREKANTARQELERARQETWTEGLGIIRETAKR
jgi:hypothetical protein